jgi:CrcB protein
MAVDSQSASDRSGGDDREEIIDSDFDRHDAEQVAGTRKREWDLLVAIAVGGVVGAEARYGVGLLLPHHAGEFPWATMLTNASGCFLIGTLMVVLLEFTDPHRLFRPFLGVGILGGFTTFSTFATDAEQLILDHRPLLALLYVLATVVCSAVAVWAATLLTRDVGQAVVRMNHGRRQGDGF